jgi:PAS domain S-box-containing protein
MLGTYHLTSLFDILKELHFIYEPKKLWKYVLEKSCLILQAEGATFFTANEEGSEMLVEAAHGVDEQKLQQIPFRSGVGVCGWVLQYQQPALVTDVTQDNRFSRQVDVVTGLKTRSVLCVPVLSQKRTYGVIELINRKSGQFGPQDQEFMTVLGRQAAAAYQNLLFLQEVEHAKTLLQSVLENLSGGLIAADPQGKILVMNPSAARLLGLASPALSGQPIQEVFKDHSWFIDILKKTLADKNAVSRQEVQLPLHGEPRRVGYTTMLISDRQKKLLGSGIIFQELPK